MNRLHRTVLKLAATFSIVIVFASTQVVAQQESQPAKPSENTAGKPVLWSDPTDLESRNLFDGPGGKQDAPQGTVFAYESEDLKGTNAKFDVHDQDGVKWKVKLGEEARPETVATRLLWAVGYFADEDYFLPKIQVSDMRPVSKKRRKRIRGLIEPDGIMHDVRLKRRTKDQKKQGTWRWRRNPFSGTRELNGLRVMMALLNNWDLKDENNSIYVIKTDGGAKDDQSQSDPTEIVYAVSDVGASFGTAGRVRQRARAKGNLASYQHSKFIRKIGPDYVDFAAPARESWTLAVNPKEYTSRLHLRWVGQHIPRSDAKWIGQLLARLSHDQISDAFRAADYPPDQVDAFTKLVEDRIAKLSDL
jgi:hypothetical protein